MGAGQFYLYLYALCCVAVGALFALGGGLVYWGRQKERLARERWKTGRDESGDEPKPGPGEPEVPR
jgi:hypothetical protein